jgi:hypothetical protein
MAKESPEETAAAVIAGAAPLLPGSLLPKKIVIANARNGRRGMRKAAVVN